MLQNEPTAAVAPAPDLVLWSRLGSAYDVRELRDAQDELAVVELRGYLRPAEDIALYRADMADWPGRGALKDWQEARRDWIHDNAECHADILERLRADGPLTSKELPDSCQVPWKSSGWNDNRNVRMMLDLMVARGEVAAAGRRGRDQLWDLASRVYPDDEVLAPEEAERERNTRRLHALGIARAATTELPGEPISVGEVGEPAVVEGVRGEWRVDPTLLDQPFAGRAALLSPFDRLVHDRRRLEELFEFEYQLEMYKPVAQRRWGYFALPVLYGDRLVGKLDATADRKAGALRVDALHEDEPLSRTARAAIDAEIRDLARWLDLDLDVAA
jgi:uncharacterized protein YcaQ